MTDQVKVMENLVSELKKMRDDIDKALIIRSDSIPPSFSGAILELKKDVADIKDGQRRHVESHIAKDAKDDQIQQEMMDFAVEQRKMNARIEPYIKKAEDDRDFILALETRGKKFGFWAGIWLTFTLVIGSIYYGIKHIK